MLGRITFLIIAVLAPVLAAPFLRHLFAMFLRQSAELFSNVALERSATLTIGSRMALNSGLIFATSVLLFVGCMTLNVPWELTAAVTVIGILSALAVCILIIRASLDVDPLPAGAIGLVSFAGGNLPFILVYPAALGLSSLV